MLRLQLNDNDDIRSIVNKWLYAHAIKQKETGGINQQNEKPARPDKPRRGMKCDGAGGATDAAAGPTCYSRCACSSGQSFRASLIQRLLASCFWLRSLHMEMPGQTEVGRNSEE